MVKGFLAHFSFAPKRGSPEAGILLKHGMDVLLLNLQQGFLASERLRSEFPFHHFFGPGAFLFLLESGEKEARFLYPSSHSHSFNYVSFWSCDKGMCINSQMSQCHGGQQSDSHNVDDVQAEFVSDVSPCCFSWSALSHVLRLWDFIISCCHSGRLPDLLSIYLLLPSSLMVSPRGF